MSLQIVTAEELGKHNKDDDLWILINGHVWDVTDFLDKHPGTRKPLLHYAGKDGSEGFNKVHKDLDPNKVGIKYVGVLSVA